MGNAWLSGPIPRIAPLLMPLAHSLVDARDELAQATEGLTPTQLAARPGGGASIAFHMRHLCGSLDRLFTYAEGRDLSDAQRAALAAERVPGEAPATREELLAVVDRAFAQATERLRATDTATLLEARTVGAKRLPSTVIGLLFHAIEHTRRHAGQVVTTAKVVR